MRIGKVSELYHISIDNLYYYIHYGLLVPPRPKGQYVFDEATCKDLEWILELKDLDFSLREIHILLSLKRVSGFADSQDLIELREIYKNKRHLCLQEVEHKKAVIEKLEKKIRELEIPVSPPEEKTGVPLSMLPLLCCPCCGRDLSMTEVEMNHRYIWKGTLACSCGYQAEIHHGILMTPNKNQNLQDAPDLTRELYKDLPPDLISLFQRSYNHMLKAMKEAGLQNKVICETYINAWFFIHNHLEYLPQNSRYIIIDKYPETLLMYKRLIEKQAPDLEILYLADSSTCFPLKPGSIDLHLDFFAANEHNFYHNTFLFEELFPYLAPKADLIGTYFYFDHAPRSMKQLLSQYPESYYKNFDLEYFHTSMKEAGYELLEEEDCGCTTDSGANLGFGFHVKGEKMHLLPYHGRKCT